MTKEISYFWLGKVKAQLSAENRNFEKMKLEQNFETSAFPIFFPRLQPRFALFRSNF